MEKRKQFALLEYLRHNKFDMVKGKQIAKTLLLALLITCWPVSAFAQYSSNQYSVDEVFFGTGGELNSCSAQYCAKESAGETAVGNTSSTNFQANAGFNTNREEYLQFVVNATNINLGVLTTSATATATATFNVKTYLAGGYVVTSMSDGPSIGGHIFNSPSSPTAAAAPGTAEQFGFNVVANTSPTTFGADPVQIPDTTFSFGTAAAGYNTANMFKYVKGDTIASSTRSSGETDYTISYIMNITNLTPAGTYTMKHELVATSTF